MKIISDYPSKHLQLFQLLPLECYYSVVKGVTDFSTMQNFMKGL